MATKKTGPLPSSVHGEVVVKAIDLSTNMYSRSHETADFMAEQIGRTANVLLRATYGLDEDQDDE